MTFTLSGFATIKREGVELTGAGVTTINADMRVGAVSETVTVTGETPVVDIQTSTKREVVLSNEVLAAVPASRTLRQRPGDGARRPVVTLDVNSTQSVTGTATNFFFTSRGGRGKEGTVQVDGMNVGSAFNGGGVSSFAYDFVNAQEVQVTVAGGMGESDRGGPAFNIIPKTGGNTFSGTAFVSTGGQVVAGQQPRRHAAQRRHHRAAGLIKNWDTNFALGGPIKQRPAVVLQQPAHLRQRIRTFPASTPTRTPATRRKWSYVKDPNVKARSAADKKIEAIRLTGQVTPRNKVGFYYDYQANCAGSALVNTRRPVPRPRRRLDRDSAPSTTSPESGNMWPEREKITQATWSSPVTSRLLFEAGVSSFSSKWGGYIPPGAQTGLVPVTEQSTAAGVPVPNFTYRGWASAASNNQQHNVWRASLAYVTGAHSLKVGYQAAYEVYGRSRTSTTS